MVKKYKKLSVLIPCHNEEKGIGRVIDSVPLKSLLTRHHIKTEVVVIDNNSTDNTVEIALKHGAKVIKENKKGKGHAMRRGFYSISPDTDFVIMLDGDATYSPKEIPRLLEPLISGFSDVIVGSRLGGRIQKYALRYPNRIVNWVYTFLTRVFYRANITDVMSGYFAFKYDVIDELKHHLTSKGFSIEMEIVTKVVKLGFAIFSVPITYSPREGESKISKIADAIKILYTFINNITWKPTRRHVKKVKRTQLLLGQGLVRQTNVIKV